MERCYRCGRVKCGTCGGSGVSWYGGVERDCPDCKDGWTEAENCPEYYEKDKENCILLGGKKCHHERCHNLAIIGTDPAVLCPRCEKEPLSSHGPVTDRTQCDVPNEGNVPKEIKVPEVCRKCGSIRCAGCGTWTWRKEYKDEAAALANDPILDTDPEALCDRCAPGTPVRYIGQGYIDRSEGSSAAGLTTEGWYFWDETWAFAHGPFATEAAADAGISKYAARLEANRG